MRLIVRSLWTALVFLGGTVCPGEVTVEDLSAAWRSTDRLEVEFREERHNPFRRIPQRFTGTIYMDRGRGVTVHYTKPTDMHLHFFEGDISRKRGSAEWERLELPGEYETLITSLFRILYWEEDWIETNWTISSEMTETGWELKLVPKEGMVLDRFFSRVLLSGQVGKLDPEKIHLFRRDRKDIEISMESATKPACFSAEEINRIFPRNG